MAHGRVSCDASGPEVVLAAFSGGNYPGPRSLNSTTTVTASSSSSFSAASDSSSSSSTTATINMDDDRHWDTSDWAVFLSSWLPCRFSLKTCSQNSVLMWLHKHKQLQRMSKEMLISEVLLLEIRIICFCLHPGKSRIEQCHFLTFWRLSTQFPGLSDFLQLSWSMTTSRRHLWSPALSLCHVIAYFISSTCLWAWDNTLLWSLLLKPQKHVILPSSPFSMRLFRSPTSVPPVLSEGSYQSWYGQQHTQPSDRCTDLSRCWGNWNTSSLTLSVRRQVNFCVEM